MSVLFTIGYEGSNVDDFVKTLLANGIKRLADVRALALSRKRGFSKKSLADRLFANGIEYFHLVQLGNPKPGREAARSGDYHRFHAIYRLHLDSKACEASLEELAKLAKELPTCLLCFEREPQCCHRSMVAGAMKASYDFAVVDLCVGHSEQPKDDAPRKSSHHSREGASAA
ncbi:MAG: DUF488 domain-containing protein [Mesorhizobium sp.]